MIPRILANNCGKDATELITKMIAKNSGKEFYGLDVENGDILKTD